jgi:hypothetical protein
VHEVWRQLHFHTAAHGLPAWFVDSVFASVLAARPICTELWPEVQMAALLNHFVSKRQQLRRHVEVEGLGRLEIYHEVELGRLKP